MGYKSKRILYIYKKLLSKHHVNVKNLSEFFSTNERTIQRDIEDNDKRKGTNAEMTAFVPCCLDYRLFIFYTWFCCKVKNIANH